MRTEDLTELGDVYANEADFEEAYRMYLEAALAGDGEGFYKLGQMYLFGDEPVTQDYEKAFKLFKLDFEATGKIRGLLDSFDESDGIRACEEGRRAFRDYIEYMIDHEEWYFYIIKANELKGGGVYPEDPAEVVHCYEEAMNHGIEMGCECLAELYYLGLGVARDYKKAYDLWQSYEGSQSLVKPYYLGEMYLHGYYVQQDSDSAAEYFRTIIDKGEFWKEDVFFQRAKARLEEMSL